MWEVEKVPGTLYGISYLIRRTDTGSYLRLGGLGEGTLHFMIRGQADQICQLLNDSDIR